MPSQEVASVHSSTCLWSSCNYKLPRGLSN